MLGKFPGVWGGTGRSSGGANELSDSLASKVRKAHQALGRLRRGGLRGTVPSGVQVPSPWPGVRALGAEPHPTPAGFF